MKTSEFNKLLVQYQLTINQISDTLHQRYSFIDRRTIYSFAQEALFDCVLSKVSKDNMPGAIYNKAHGMIKQERGAESKLNTSVLEKEHLENISTKLIKNYEMFGPIIETTNEMTDEEKFVLAIHYKLVIHPKSFQTKPYQELGSRLFEERKANGVLTWSLEQIKICIRDNIRPVDLKEIVEIKNRAFTKALLLLERQQDDK